MTVSIENLSSDSCLRRVHPFPYHPGYGKIEKITLFQSISQEEWDGIGTLPSVAFWNCDPDYLKRFEYYNFLINHLSQVSMMPEWYDETKLPKWYGDRRDCFTHEEQGEIERQFSGGFVFDKLPKGAKAEWFDQDGKFNLIGLHCDTVSDYDGWMAQKDLQECPICRKIGTEKLQLQVRSQRSFISIPWPKIDVSGCLELAIGSEKALRYLSQSLLAIFFTLSCMLGILRKCGVQGLTHLEGKVATATQLLIRIGIAFQVIGAAKKALKLEKEVFTITLGLSALGFHVGPKKTALVSAALGVTFLLNRYYRSAEDQSRYL